jgi:peroxiredoxin
MRRLGWIVFAGIFLWAAVAGAVGETAVDFNLKDMKNADFRLGDHLGEKVIVMSFWMSWCKPCMVEMPQLEKLYKKYKDQGFLVIGINADDVSNVAKAKAIVRQKRLTYPVLFDTSTKVTANYNPNTMFPYTVIIGKDKKVAYVKKGFSAGDQNLIEKEILKLLGEQGAQ